MPSASITTDIHGALHDDRRKRAPARRAPRSTAAGAAASPAIRRRTPRRSRRGARRSSPRRLGELGDLVRRRAPALRSRADDSRPNADEDTSAGEERDAVERHRLRVIDEPRQLAEIQPVQRGARGDRHVRARAAAAAPRRARPSSAPRRRGRPDTALRSPRRATRSRARTRRATSAARPLEQHAARVQVQRDAACAEHRRGLEHLRPQQRLAAGEEHDARAERRQRVGDARRSPPASDRRRRCDFHQSHDTQRLLQRLVGKKITTGSTNVRFVSSPRRTSERSSPVCIDLTAAARSARQPPAG